VSLLVRNPGIGDGYTALTRVGDDVGFDFGILRLCAGETIRGDGSLERAWVLLDGEARFEFDGRRETGARRSLFDQAPVVLHAPAGAKPHIHAERDCEFAVVAAENPRAFPIRLFDAESLLETEQRDRGLWDDTARRVVRTVFDFRNRPDASLVLGEVVNLPGRWSSYPPHHHAQPEIYHYRFTHPDGYGHGESGEQVFRVRHGDTLKILGGDHSQVAAPGYGMYYLWIVRHLAGNPYRGFEFAREHRWLREPGARIWRPEEA